jgi:hypothetical protein
LNFKIEGVEVAERARGLLRTTVVLAQAA